MTLKDLLFVLDKDIRVWIGKDTAESGFAIGRVGELSYIDIEAYEDCSVKRIFIDDESNMTILIEAKEPKTDYRLNPFGKIADLNAGESTLDSNFYNNDGTLKVTCDVAYTTTSADYYDGMFDGSYFESEKNNND